MPSALCTDYMTNCRNPAPAPATAWAALPTLVELARHRTGVLPNSGSSSRHLRHRLWLLSLLVGQLACRQPASLRQAGNVPGLPQSHETAPRLLPRRLQALPTSLWQLYCSGLRPWKGETQHLRDDLQQAKTELATARSQLAESKVTLITRLQEHTSHCVARETAVKVSCGSW